jgi:DNA modification methylase
LHPACKIFPALGREDLQELADDIAENDLRNPIVRHQGKLLAGRNRWDACPLAKVEPRFTEFDGDDPIGWVVSQNLVRRHLTASQRAVVAFDLLPMLEKEAKQRQRRSNSYKGNGRSASHGANQNGKGKASEMAARIAKSSSRNVERVKAISKQAPELIEEIRAGKVKVSDAEKLAELPEQQRAQLLDNYDGNGDVFTNWKRENKSPSPPKPVKRTARERKTRLAATSLACGDCRKELKKLRKGSVDLVLADPPYPEARKSYGKMAEAEWHELMNDVVGQCRRVLKPHGSAVFILQPNYEKVGRMRLWVWEFLLWAAREWNLVQDAYWWGIDTLPAAGTNRRQGLLRHSVKLCLWLGAPDCYRNQDAVLWEPSDGHAARKWSDRALKNRPSGHNVRDGRAAETSVERGGTTPFNLLPIPNTDTRAAEDHPATTPYDVAAWWCRYLLPPDGVLCDPFCGSGTMLQAGLDCRASKVIGIDKVRKYLATAKRRVRNS